MLPKFAWVLGPLLLYGVVCVFLALRGRTPSRMALNVHLSLLLLVYLLGTAGLGIFWVANQQLPVFDWHYLFGYATLLLVALHLVFNLPVVVRWLSRKRTVAGAPKIKTGGPAWVGKGAALALGLAAAFYIGARQGGANVQVSAAAVQENPIARYHAFSSESRASVFQRAPGVAWGDAPPAFKSYPDAVRVALEKGGPGKTTLAQALAAPAPGRRLTLAGLGRVLYLSSGVTLRRGGYALRAAPSSGALFPSELYIAARHIDGLSPGLYHYDPDQHRLDLLGPLPPTVGTANADDADAIVLLTAVFRRTGYKYHNRAYRYALADAGHLLENLRLASHGAGMDASLLRQFDDGAAAQALGIDGVEEGVLALMTLRPSTGAERIEQPQQDQTAATQYTPVVAQPATAIGVTGVVHQATSLRSAPRPAAEVDLPPPVSAARELFTTIVQRRSERRFTDEPIPLALLSGVLADLRQRPQLYEGIEISIVVNRVAGLAPGVYRYLPRHALALVRAGDFAGAAQSAALSQDAIGDAAAVLVLSTDRERLLAGGARQYRHALLETGLIGERWLLGAVARGLAACPVGAFYDDEAAALIGVDPARHWVFHFAALGLPEDD
jgi:SagB-type dehydrogenase family enzyme